VLGGDGYFPRPVRRPARPSAADLDHSVKVDYRSWRRRSVADRFLELLATPIRPLL